MQRGVRRRKRVIQTEGEEGREKGNRKTYEDTKKQ